MQSDQDPVEAEIAEEEAAEKSYDHKLNVDTGIMVAIVLVAAFAAWHYLKWKYAPDMKLPLR